MLGRSLHRVLAFVLLASVSCYTANGDTSSDSALAAFSQIPACGIQCISQSLPAIGCGLLDVECQCNSKNSTKILQPCLETLCTYEETFSILHIQASLCNKPHDSLTTPIRITAYFSGITPVVVIIMRFTSRYLGGNEFWWDDWTHLASVILAIPMSVFLLLNLDAGLGRHLWDLTYPNVVTIGKLTYIASVLWGFELLLLKYSILCLYLRIFPNVWLKRAVFAFMAFTALFTLPLLGLAAFQCIPVSAIWNLQERGTAKCVDWIIVLRLTVVYEVIAEIVLFSLPIPIVLKLQMKTAKKIQLIVFFGLGVCVIAVAIARVPFLPGVVDTSDQTYTVAGSSITGFAASAVGHICAAVPTVWSLLRHFQKGSKLATKPSSSYAQEITYNSSGKRSYKSLQDKKDNLKTAQEQSIGSSRDAKDPFRLSSILDAEDDVEFVELGPVQPYSRTYTQPNEERVGQQVKGAWAQRVEEQPPTIVRKSPSPELDDSASNKAMLHNDPYA